MDGVTVMGIGAGIDDNTLRSVKVGILNSVDNGAFVVALEHFYLCAGFFAFFGNQI